MQQGAPGERHRSPCAWPSFSIVVPTHQRRDVVCGAVRKVAELNYDGAIELIVVVDGSTDRTVEAVREIVCPFPVRIFEQFNEGASRARNRGAAAARNDIILFLDDDMICEPTLLEEHARLHLEGAEAVIGDTPIDPDSPPGFLPESVGRWIASTRVQDPLSPFDIFTGQLSVRRSVFHHVGGFDADFTTGSAFGNEDADFGVRLLAGHDVRHNPEAISRQRYVVTPREYMERARLAAEADLRFVRKHPELARQLFGAKGASTPLARFVYRPLTRLPLVTRLLAGAAIRTAEIGSRTAFRSNRILARFFSGARSLAYWSELRRGGWFPLSNRLLVLCYHAIQDQSSDPVLARYGVPPELFAAHLNSLARRGFTFVSPDALGALLTADAPLPRRAVLLTFDDCYSDLVELARDILHPRGIEALAFAVTGTATNEWDQAYGATKLQLLGQQELRELASLGIEIGSHSRSHREMPLLGAKRLFAETAGSATDLAAIGLPRPRYFAYPYGAVDGATKAAAKDSGFLAAFGLRQRRLHRERDLFDLPRVIVLASDRGWRFSFKTAAPRIFGQLDRAIDFLKRFAGRANVAK